MKFKRVKTGKETTLAVWDGSRWLGLKSALKAFELKGSELWQLSDDLIGLLGRFCWFQAELNELMRRSQGTVPDLPDAAGAAPRRITRKPWPAGPSIAPPRPNAATT